MTTLPSTTSVEKWEQFRQWLRSGEHTVGEVHESMHQLWNETDPAVREDYFKHATVDEAYVYQH
jgi:hypothetical protein